MNRVVSSRRKKFYKLLVLAHDQPSSWLASVLQNPEREGLGPVPVLSRLACLRTLVGRHPSGQPYLYKKRLVRKELGI